MSQTTTAMPLLIVVSGVIISMCMGLRQSLGLFMRPMAIDSASSRRRSASRSRCRTSSGACRSRSSARSPTAWRAPVLTRPRWSTQGPAADGVLQPRPAGCTWPASAGVGTAGTGFGVLIGAVSRASRRRNAADRRPGRRRRSLGTLVHRARRPALIDGLGWQAALTSSPRSQPRWCFFAADPRAQGRATPPRRQPAGRTLRRGRASRLPVHDARVLRLRLPDRVHHDAPAALPAAVRRGAGGRRNRARPDRPVQHDRHLPAGLLGARYSQKHCSRSSTSCAPCSS